MSIVLPYEFIFYIVHICNNSKKGKQDIFRYLIHLASVCSIISKDHGQIYLFLKLDPRKWLTPNNSSDF